MPNNALNNVDVRALTRQPTFNNNQDNKDVRILVLNAYENLQIIIALFYSMLFENKCP